MNNIKDMWCHFKNSDDNLYEELNEKINTIKENNKKFIINCVLVPRIIKEDLRNRTYLQLEEIVENAIIKAEIMFDRALEKDLLNELYQIKE